MARVLFLGGLGRSGTTLIERVLGELPGVCALGEVVHLWQRDIRDDERCGCGVRFSGCDVLAARSARRRSAAGTSVDVVPHPGAAGRGRAHPAHPPAGRGAGCPTSTGAGRGVRRLLRRDLPRPPPRSPARAWSSTRPSTARWRTACAGRTRPRPAGRARGPGPARRRVLLDQDGAPAGDRRRRGDDPLLPRPVGAAVERAQRRVRPARPPRRRRCAGCGTRSSWPTRAPRCSQLAAFAGLDVSGDATWTSSATTHADLRVGHSAAGNPMRFTVGRVPLRRDDAWRQRAARAASAALVGAVCAPLLRARTATRSGRDDEAVRQEDGDDRRPSVGVVIPTRNRPELLRRAIERGPRAGLPGRRAGRRGLRPEPSRTSCWPPRDGVPVHGAGELAHARPGRRPQHRHPGAGHRAGGVLRRRRPVGAGQAAPAGRRAAAGRTPSSPPARSRSSTRAGARPGWPAATR